MWVSFSEDNVPLTAKITHWNTVKMHGIYDRFIENEIKRQIKFFGAKGGDVYSYNLSKDNTLSIVELAMNEGIPDITAEISPLVFYCSSCGNVFKLSSSSNVNYSTWRCKNCGKNTVKQLQMIYACECGQAIPVKIPYAPGAKELKYRTSVSQYKMFYTVNGAERPAELQEKCPSCGALLRPNNASAGANYKAFSISVINLVDDRCGKFFEKGIDSRKTVISRWFNKISEEDYEYFLDHVDLAYSDEVKSDSKRREAENQAKQLLAMGLISESQLEMTISTLLGNTSNTRSIETFANECDDLFRARLNTNPMAYADWINYFSFKLMQYFTIRDSKRTISLDDAIRKQLELEFIFDPEEITELNDRLGISAMQVSCDVQIVNCTYGFTRKTADPARARNKAHALKLNAYDKTRDGEANYVYAAKLDTEGILFEISQKKIIEWLYKNNVISEALLPDLDDDSSVKRWFAEYVKGESIPQFGDIPDPITRHVFGLLHSMSHAFIIAAGELCGLYANSLTELIFVETGSIFIYSQSNQEITLGALSGMVETNYASFLRNVFDNSRHCVFDPICTDRDHTACSACVIIPEVSCKHFNAQLGRKYLYSFPAEEDIKIGFWEM